MTKQVLVLAKMNLSSGAFCLKLVYLPGSISEVLHCNTV